MTKIEELENEVLIINDYGHEAYLFRVTELEAYKAAIREQVVIDALPSDGMRASVAIAYPTEAEEKAFLGGMDWFQNIITKTLTTREEVERPYVELLMELAGIALPYMTTEQKQKLNSLTDGK